MNTISQAIESAPEGCQIARGSPLRVHCLVSFPMFWIVLALLLIYGASLLWIALLSLFVCVKKYCRERVSKPYDTDHENTRRD